MGHPTDLAVSPIFSVKNRSVTRAKIGRCSATLDSPMACSLTDSSLHDLCSRLRLCGVGFAPQRGQQLLQVGREGGATFEPLPRGWVHQPHHPGMQRLSTEPGQLVRQWGTLQRILAAAIGGIAQQRMAHSSHVDADLMCTAGAGLQLYESIEAKALQHAKFGDGLA